MDARTERRHQPRSKALPGQRDFTIISQEGQVRSMMTVKLLDYNDECLSVEAGNRLADGTFAEIVGEIEQSRRPPNAGPARLRPPGHAGGTWTGLRSACS